MKTEAEAGVMPQQAREPQRSPANLQKLGESLGRPPGSAQKDPSLPTP